MVKIRLRKYRLLLISFFTSSSNMSTNCMCVGCCLANVLITSSTVISSLMCIIANTLSFPLDIVLLNQVFIRRKAETERLHSQVVTGTTARFLRATKIFGKASWLQFFRVSAMLSCRTFSNPFFQVVSHNSSSV